MFYFVYIKIVDYYDKLCCLRAPKIAGDLKTEAVALSTISQTSGKPALSPERRRCIIEVGIWDILSQEEVKRCNTSEYEGTSDERENRPYIPSCRC